MELSKFNNGISVHNNIIQKVIDEDDFYVMHEADYSYTVGMRNIGSPELVIYGQSKAVAEEMFKIIYTAASQVFVELDLNVLVKRVFDPIPILIELSESDKKALFYAARTYYDDWTFSALKITMNTTSDANA